MQPEMLRELSALGINPSSMPEIEILGISSAVGCSPENQAEIDDWIAAGGVLEFEE
jgi:hypothetical protein